MSFNIMDYVMGVLIFASLLELGNNEWHFKDVPQNWLVLAFFVAALMSHASHVYWTAAYEVFKGFGKIILIYYLISINLTTLSRVRGFILAIIVGCLFMSVHGILQFHTGFGFGGQEPMRIPGENSVRIVAFGFFTDPNDLALALVVALPFVVNGIHRAGVSAPKRLLNLVLAGVLGYAIFLTNSRGGWLALAVMMMSYLLLNFRMKKSAAVVGILITIALMMVAPGRVSTGSLSGKDQSAHDRLVAWSDGNRMLKQSPIFGVGKGRFGEFSETGKVAHNSFVHCYGELGLFGYFFWIGLLFASAKDSYAMGKTAPSESDPDPGEAARIARAVLPALIGYMAAAVFLSRTYTPLLIILFGLVAAMRAMRERAAGPVPRAFVKRECKWVLLTELASIPVFYAWIRLAL
jgi:putative inorganic carbon (hco3(-)) transporter